MFSSLQMLIRLIHEWSKATDILSTYVLSCVVAGSRILNEHVRVAQRADNSRNRVRRWQKFYSTPLGADSIRMNLHFNGSFCISHSAPESYRRALADPFHDARGGGIRSVKELSVLQEEHAKEDWEWETVETPTKNNVWCARPGEVNGTRDRFLSPSRDFSFPSAPRNYFVE